MKSSQCNVIRSVVALALLAVAHGFPSEFYKQSYATEHCFASTVCFASTTSGPNGNANPVVKQRPIVDLLFAVLRASVTVAPRLAGVPLANPCAHTEKLRGLVVANETKPAHTRTHNLSPFLLASRMCGACIQTFTGKVMGKIPTPVTDCSKSCCISNPPAEYEAGEAVRATSLLPWQGRAGQGVGGRAGQGSRQGSRLDVLARACRIHTRRVRVLLA